MKNIRKISYAVAALVVTTAASCSKQLKEYNPHGTTPDKMYNTPGGFTSLVNMAYQDLHNVYGIEDGFFLCETGTDLWFNEGRGTYADGITQYKALNPGKPDQPKKHWNACYKGINYCNTGIELIDQAGFTSEKEKNQRLAELRFLRALYYYHIVEQFGGVYLNTTSTLNGVELNPTRSKPEEFYDLMIGDLEFAKNNLPVSWPATEYSRASKKSAMGLLARVLLTRAYYSTGGEAQTWFTKAKDAAVEAINTATALGVSLYGKYSDIGQSVYGTPANRAANKEAMFVLAYSEASTDKNYNTSSGNRIFKWTLMKYREKPGMSTAFINAYGVENDQRMMPTWHLLDLFDETKDGRYNACFQELWIANKAWPWTADNISNTDKIYIDKDPSVIGSEIKVGDTAMFLTKRVWGGRRTRKYMEIDRNELYDNPQPGQGAAIQNSTQYTHYFPSFKKFVNINRTTTATTDFGDALIIRLGEMYLIAAEAFVQLGDQASAATYVNKIRERAALPGQTAAMQVAPAQIDIQFILDERGREFAGELQRWYDLKRVFRDKNQWAKYIKDFNPDLVYIEPHHWLRPVPQSELDALLNPTVFGQNEGYTQPQ
jgi:starch-binding outer membrane protein, SusD/RagB family